MLEKIIRSKLVFLIIVILTFSYSLVRAAQIPNIIDSFSDSSKIASISSVVVDDINGQVYLTENPWTCGDALVDSRDSKSYATVLIDSQCWTQENMNIGTMIAGTGNQGTSCASIQKYCYDNDEGNCTTYGGLYQWNQTMCGVTAPGSVGICPTGWHVPTHDEFTTLERAVCTSGSCATDFPYDTTTTGYRGTNEGTILKDITGPFKGKLSGYRFTFGNFFSLRSNDFFWSSVSIGSSAWDHGLFSSSAGVSRNTHDNNMGFSVRCLKD